jgi:hypothetical protein
MKQLKLEISLSEYNEKPCIFLGFSEKLQHHSKTFLNTYLRTYKKVIKDNLRILNNYNAQIYSLFRNFYFDINTSDTRQISIQFKNFNDNFDWIFDNVGGCQNSIMMLKISQCIGINITILQIMKTGAQINKNYALKNQSESLLKMMNDFETIFNNDKMSLDLDRDYAKDNLIYIKNQIKKQA